MPKAYRVFAAMPALPQLKSVPVAYTVTEARELMFLSGLADTVIEALVDKGSKIVIHSNHQHHSSSSEKGSF
jgi:hypothetical protein